MFGFHSKKKLKEVARENAAAFGQVIENTRMSAERSDKIADAGERYLALVNLEDRIQAEILAGEKKINFQIGELLQGPRDKACILGGFGSAFLGCAVLAVTFSITAAPVGIAALVAMGGIAVVPTGIAVAFAGIFVGPGRNASLFDDSIKNFTTSINDVSKIILQKKDAILRDELPGLAASPFFEELYDRVPAVKDAFIKAATRAGIVAPPVIRLDKPQFSPGKFGGPGT